MLRPLSAQIHPSLLVGLHTADDAAVYRLSDEHAVVQTVDFFPPIVDDAYTYGAIAAANSLSDVYAMGGRPVFALNVAGWPADLSLDMLSEVFRGGMEKVAEAGAVIAGGHTVQDPEPKYGLSVTGLVHPDRITTKSGARPGDRLVLTKPLGTGAVTTALKAERADDEDVAAALRSMLQLNRAAAELAAAHELRTVTDITGFGLLGHAYEMAAASGTCLRISLSSLPVLPGALRYIREGLVPGGNSRNRAYLENFPGVPRARWTEGADRDLLTLALDPQTSGGLLMAVPADRLSRLLGAARDAGTGAWLVGEVAEGVGVEVVA